jgi:hypothetical protein
MFSTADLIGSLDVEEKERAKDTCGKGVVGSSSTNLVRKNNSNAFHNNNNKKNKPDNYGKARQTTSFKKKKEKGKSKFYTCGLEGHFAKECKDNKYRPKSANMIISKTGGILGYGNYLPTFLSVCHSPYWCVDTGANIHVCVDISLFSSYQVGGTSSLLIWNGSHVHVLGAGTVDLKLTSGKTVRLRNMQYVPTIRGT